MPKNNNKISKSKAIEISNKISEIFKQKPSRNGSQPSEESRELYWIWSFKNTLLNENFEFKIEIEINSNFIAYEYPDPIDETLEVYDFCNTEEQIISIAQEFIENLRKQGDTL